MSLKRVRQLAAQFLIIQDLAVENEVARLVRLAMGCWDPCKSMMESRVCHPYRSVQPNPCCIGPRCRSSVAICASVSRSTGAPSNLLMPAIPHTIAVRVLWSASAGPSCRVSWTATQACESLQPLLKCALQCGVLLGEVIDYRHRRIVLTHALSRSLLRGCSIGRFPRFVERRPHNRLARSSFRTDPQFLTVAALNPWSDTIGTHPHAIASVKCRLALSGPPRGKQEKWK